MDTINILDTEIEIRRPGQNVYSFGDTSQKNTAHLRSANETIGFLNALQDVMDGAYPVREPGFHSKVGWEALLTKWEEESLAYVNFDMPIPTSTLARLAEMGIKKLEGRTGWLVLNGFQGRFKPSHYAAPKTRKDLIGDRDISTIHPDEFTRNEHEWNILHKHNGVELVSLLLGGSIRVICTPSVQSGFEWRATVIEKKVLDLFGAAEDRLAHRQATIQRMYDRASTARNGFYVRKYTEMEARADQIVAEEGLFVIKDGQAVAVEVTDLVKTRISLFLDGNLASTRYPHNVEEVKGVVLFARANNLTLNLL